jgi:hypothetical protein
MMKKYMIMIALYSLSIQLSFAADPAYQKAMGAQLQKLETAQSAEQLRDAANGFSRIAEMNQDEWLPNYYAALALINAGFRTEGLQAKDAFYHEAKALLEKTVQAHGESAELLALKGYALMAELSADPGSRGQSMSGEVMNTFGRALALDAQNPRAMLLMAQMELGTAQFFGQGPEKACGMVQNSIKLFEQEESRQADATLTPVWGKDMAVKIAAQCP